MTIQGRTIQELETAAESFSELVFGHMRKTAEQVVSGLGQTQTAAATSAVSESDLSRWRTVWAQVVDGVLLGSAVDEWRTGATSLFAEFAGVVPNDILERAEQIFTPGSDAAERYLSGARNRLVDLGDEVWERMRTGLSDGVAAGEGIDQIQQRVMDEVDLSRARARVIARTEVVGASNTGSIEFARSLGIEMEKEWMAAMDMDTRPSHAAADGQKVDLEQPFIVGGSSLDRPGDFSGPPEETVNCFPGDVLVQSLSGIRKVYRRWYEGVLIRIDLANGMEVSGTPNHPVLTDSGWKPLHLLDVDDQLIQAKVAEGVGFGQPEIQDVPTSFAELYRTASEFGTTNRVSGRAVDFHGDGSDSEVEIVAIDRNLTMPVGGGAADPSGIGYGLLGLSSEVAVFDAVGIERLSVVRFSGHVYNLETDIGWYTANRTICSNCRCTMGFEIGPEPEPIVASDFSDLAVIDLRPSPEDAQRLAIESGLAPEYLHVTLVFLGEASNWQGDVLDELLGGLPVHIADAEVTEPIKGTACAAAVFNPQEPYAALALLMNGQKLQALQRAVGYWAADFDIPEQYTPWIPHMTLQYDAAQDVDLSIAAGLCDGTEIVFDRLSVDIGTDRHEIALGGTISDTTASAGVDMETFQEQPIDEPTEELSGDVAHWSGVLVVEGTPTGDGRQFAPGALIWGELPIPLRWQKEDSHGGMPTDVTVNVGRIEEIWRDANKIMGRGVLDLGSEDGREAHRRMEGGFLSGVSIDADDPEHAEIEYVYPEGCEGVGIFDIDEDITLEDLDEIERCSFPELMIFHSGRIRAATLVDLPAFVEAQLVLDDDNGPVTAAAVPVHDTGTSDGPWEGSENEARLDSPMPEATAEGMYAWIDSEQVEDGEVVKEACKFPHHEVSQDGQPGAANLTACSAVIGALHGARAEPDIPDADREGVYNHVAQHLRDGGQEPPPLEEVQARVDAVTAAAHTISIPDRPPGAWFSKPDRMPEIGAITVTDEGRIYGYLAPRKVSHRGYRERRTVPMGNVDYTRWMNRPTILEDGTRLPTGPITMSCGHASTGYSDGDLAMDHYENSCSIVGTARVGEDLNGVWIAGSLLPDVSASQVARMLACQLSGDWRPHKDRQGWRELAGALLVPVPGFPMASARVSVRLDEADQLVASAVPVHFLRGGDTTGGPPAGSKVITDAARRLASSIGLDRGSKMRKMAQEVRG